MKRKRINLSEEPLEKNKAFSKALLEAGLQQTDHEFTEQKGIGPLYEVDRSVEGMTLDKYLAGMSNTVSVFLDIGVREQNHINYHTNYRVTPIHKLSFDLDVGFYTSYNQVRDLFQEVYGKDMEEMKSEPLPDF